ncbi:MAG: beta-ketoacyl-ACP synthase III [Planctomycetota bacterium]|jgi:3-oxoacyl-[acyl-carrier-protein] synthase-3
MPRAHVVAVGSALPDKRLTNADLEQMVDTNDEWIVSRTGIRERRVVEPGTPLSVLALPAAEQCLQRAGVNADQLDGIIIATITPDHVMPATANIIQHQLGASKAWGFDLANACNGFVAALSTATAFIEAGRAQHVLVIGGDVMSSVVDYRDRNTCILFGDGAGAVLLSAGSDNGGIAGFELGSDGGHGELLAIPASGSAAPRSGDSTALPFVHQEGREVFKHAVRRMAQVSSSLLKRLDKSGDDIDLLVPHQANLRIIEPTARRLGLPMDKVVVNIEHRANTTAATIPLALADAYDDGRLRPGTRVMLAAFGGGFAWGAAYFTFG